MAGVQARTGEDYAVRACLQVYRACLQVYRACRQVYRACRQGSSSGGADARRTRGGRASGKPYEGEQEDSGDSISYGESFRQENCDSRG